MHSNGYMYKLYIHVGHNKFYLQIYGIMCAFIVSIGTNSPLRERGIQIPLIDLMQSFPGIGVGFVSRSHDIKVIQTLVSWPKYPLKEPTPWGSSYVISDPAVDRVVSKEGVVFSEGSEEVA